MLRALIVVVGLLLASAPASAMKVATCMRSEQVLSDFAPKELAQHIQSIAASLAQPGGLDAPDVYVRAGELHSLIIELAPYEKMLDYSQEVRRHQLANRVAPCRTTPPDKDTETQLLKLFR